jgi:hypothetical protein
VRRNLSILAVLFAWLIATGSQWDLIQVFAWGKMMATYSRIMPLRDAVALTFTPGNLCDICRLVDAAKEKQTEAGNPAASQAPEKPLVICVAPAVVVQAPAPTFEGLAEPKAPCGIGRAAPPLPPPRGEIA